MPEIVKDENKKSLQCSGRVQDSRSRGPQSQALCGQKENLSQVHSEHNHHQSFCTRVKYLKLSEVKTKSCHGSVLSAELEIQRSQFKTWCGKKKIFHRSNQNNTTTSSSAAEFKYLKLTDVKNRSHCCAMVEVEKMQVRDLVYKYKDVFSLRDKKGLCPNIEIKIDVTDKSPFFITQFHSNEEDKVSLDKEMK